MQRLFVFLMFTAAAVLSAAPVAGQTGNVDIHVQEEEGPSIPLGPLRGFSSYGANLGLMRISGGDLAKGAQIRPVLQGSFRYRFNDDWIGLGEFGFGWNSFKDRGDTVFAVTYGTLGAERRVFELAGTVLRLGGGGGFYRWNYKFSGKSIRDPITQRFSRGISPGGYLGLEGERRLTRHVTMTGSVQQHYVATANADDFERYFDANHAFLTIRAGVHYHFSPYEGILWERRASKSIQLESGKGGK